MTLYTLYMEGDFGQDGLAFSSKEKAKAYAKQLFDLQMTGEDFEEFWGDYCGTHTLEVDPA